MAKIRSLLDDNSVHTVCEEAKCPNIGECFSSNTVTFMLMGDVCTRNCAFCGVNSGKPSELNKNEPAIIASSAKKLGLKYIVLTSVTRDDIFDGGASHFADTIKEIKKEIPESKIEVLIPDLLGNINSLKTICDACPDVINHNMETVNALYNTIRPQAIYERSLKVLKNAKTLNNSLYTKSGFMLGLGEKKDDVFALIRDLKNANCDILTIGQYLRPSKDQTETVEFVKPEIFDLYREEAEKMGFLKVFSGPFVRSSYKAQEIFKGN